MAHKLPCDCNSLSEVMDCYCDSSATLSTFRKAITDILQFVWKNPSSFGYLEENLKCLTFSDDPEKSGLEITPSTQWDIANTAHVPGILIKFPNGVQYQNPAINNIISENVMTGRMTTASIASTKCTITHRHYDGNVAGIMSDLTVMVGHVILPYLQRMWSWLQFLYVEMQTDPKLIKPEDSTNGWFEADVIFNIQFVPAFDVTYESPRWTGVSIGTTAQVVVDTNP